MGPVGLAIMSSVPNELRGQANSLSVLIMHLLGDFPSPFVIGALSQYVGFYVAYIILAAWLYFGSFAWFLSWQCAVTFTQKHPEKGLVAIGTFGLCGAKVSPALTENSDNEVKLV